jgi:hypothetical protein
MTPSERRSTPVAGGSAQAASASVAATAEAQERDPAQHFQRGQKSKDISIGL